MNRRFHGQFNNSEPGDIEKDLLSSPVVKYHSKMSNAIVDNFENKRYIETD